MLRDEQTGQCSKEGGLAAGVGTKDHGDLAVRDLHVEVLDDPAVVIRQGQLAAPDRRAVQDVPDGCLLGCHR